MPRIDEDDMVSDGDEECNSKPIVSKRDDDNTMAIWMEKMIKQDGCVTKELHNIVLQDGKLDIPIEEVQEHIESSEMFKRMEGIFTKVDVEISYQRHEIKTLTI